MIARALCVLLTAAMLPVSLAAADDVAAPTERRASIISEPENLALLAAGVAGLLIGRQGSRSRRRRDD